MKTTHLLLCALLTFSTCEVNAQSFWKKLEKGLKKVDKATEKVTNTLNNVADITSGTTTTDTNTSSSSNSGDNKQLSSMRPLQGLDLVLERVVRDGDNVFVYFNVTNNTGKEIAPSWMSTSTYEKYQYVPYAFDANSTSYDCWTYQLGNASANSLGDYIAPSLLAGVKMRGIFKIRNVPTSVTSISKMRISLKFSSNNAYYGYNYVNLPIETVKNTNLTNMTCTLPSINVKYTGTKDDGKDKTLLFTITNTGVKSERISLGDVLAYDTDGNAYDLTGYGTLGNDSWKYPSDSNAPLNVPVKASLTLKDAAGVNAFSMIRIVINRDYKIEIRNLQCEIKIK